MIMCYYRQKEFIFIFYRRRYAIKTKICPQLLYNLSQGIYVNNL